jgi:hypothetical protein
MIRNLRTWLENRLGWAVHSFLPLIFAQSNSLSGHVATIPFSILGASRDFTNVSHPPRESKNWGKFLRKGSLPLEVPASFRILPMFLLRVFKNLAKSADYPSKIEIPPPKMQY